MGNIVQTLFSASGITDSTRMLHTPGEFAKKNLLYVQEVGRLKSLQPHQSTRENLDSFLLIGILSGEGTVTVKGQNYSVKCGDCVFLNCMEKYVHESSEKNPWELTWVHFNGNSAKAYYELFMSKNNQHPIFKPGSMKELEQAISSLMECQKEKDLESELESGAILLKLLNKVVLSAMHTEKLTVEKDSEVYRSIREFVNEKYPTGNLMAVIVDKFGYEENELNKGFQSAYGIELQDYILNRRFTAAKELLRFTIKPIKEIVEESGIGNGDLFRRLFLDSEGMSPEEYRNKWAQWIK